MNAKRISGVGTTLFLAFLIMVTPVFAAANPHFGKVNPSGPDDEGSLTVDFSAGGIYYPPLGVNVSATRDTIFACKPPVGDFPPNPYQQEIIDTVQGGTVARCVNSCRGSITIPPPVTSLTCEGSMIPTLAMIIYSDLNIYGIFGDFQVLQKKINGTYSATYYGYTP